MNYKKVIEDFANGTLDKDRVTLVMDNDGGYWMVSLDLAMGETEYALGEREALVANKLKAEYGSPGGYGDIVDVLNAAGVNAEWC